MEKEKERAQKGWSNSEVERVSEKWKKTSLSTTGISSFFAPLPSSFPLLLSLRAMNGSSDPFADGGDDGDSSNPLAALGALLEASPVAPLVAKFRQRQQHLLDASTPHVGRRWASLAALVLLYALRVWSLQGFYIVTYALGIYNLNLLLGFLTPQVSFCILLRFFDSPSIASQTSFSLSFPTPFLFSLSFSPYHPKQTDRPRARGAHPPFPALRRVPPVPAKAPGIQVLVG